MASRIEWTDRTWNPVRGCTRVSEGCRNCYAETMAARNLPGMRSPTTGEPFAVRTPGGPRWTGRVELIPSKLREPLRWRKPARVFVNSMSDLFHEALRDEQIAHVFGVMAAAQRHTFQILTKRPERMREWFEWAGQRGDGSGIGGSRICPVTAKSATEWAGMSWPLPNVWLGVSVEDQATADLRIPKLIETPAAVRFVSLEPLLSGVDLRGYLTREIEISQTQSRLSRGIDWCIVGGESGPGARPFDVAWARSIVRQCREAGVACFVKQLGAKPYDSLLAWKMLDRRETPTPDHAVMLAAMSLKSKKGGDPSEWPEDLRVREFPAVRA